MKPIFALILVVFIGCKHNHDHHDHQNHQTNETESPLYKEVMAIHDAVMPEITTIHNLKKALKAAQDDSNKEMVLAHIIKLNEADEAMMSWMAAFKSLNFKKWNHWLVHAPKAFTPAGNMQSPGYARVVDWISEAWAELDSNMIASSFQCC
jgi:hypothetical protein